jgi:probable rRNA maturation factor
LGVWLERVAPASSHGAVNVAIVPDARVRELNRQYLGRDYATDVLSFPANDSAHSRFRVRGSGFQVRFWDRTKNREPGIQNRFLGDVVIARGVARRQAAAEHHSEQTELRILALHGFLHLLGYDHEVDKGEMARVERRLRRKGGLPPSLIERS